jgi:hypothetical protein
MVSFYIFPWKENLVAPLIATPNVDKCNRRQTRKGSRGRLHAICLILMQNKYYYFCKQLGRTPSTIYAMRRKQGVKMRMEIAGSILASALFVLKLHVALARAPGKIANGSGGRVEDFALHGCWSMH